MPWRAHSRMDELKEKYEDYRIQFYRFSYHNKMAIDVKQKLLL